jgi:hypothetical protein
MDDPPSSAENSPAGPSEARRMGEKNGPKTVENSPNSWNLWNLWKNINNLIARR